MKNLIDTYLNHSSWDLKENSNFQYSYNSLRNYIASNTIKTYWLKKVFSKRECERHISGDFHIHDLDNLCPYCIGWDTFTILQDKDKSSLKTIENVLDTLLVFLKQMSYEWTGAQSLNGFDIALLPYIKTSGKFKEILFNQIKRFFSCINSETPLGKALFVNLGLKLYDKSLSKNEQKKLTILNHTLFDVLLEGNEGFPYVFPLININIDKGFNWNSSVFNKIMKFSLKYGSPYFQNFLGMEFVEKNTVKIKNIFYRDPDDVLSMCCRLRLDLSVIKERQGIFNNSILTGSLSVVTINLPRIGYICHHEKSELRIQKSLSRLKKVLTDACSVLDKRAALYNAFLEKDLFPYTKKILKRKYQNHFNTIGIIGMNEFIRNLYHDTISYSSPEGIKIAKKILNYINDFLNKRTRETGMLYNLEATPAEGASYLLALKDKKQFPKIKTTGNGKNIYYTNSTQLPAHFSEDIFSLVEHQSSLQMLYTGGSVFHIYINPQNTSQDVCKQLLRKLIENYPIPTFTLSPVFSICENGHNLRRETTKCPLCGKKAKVWTRVMGFYRPQEKFNIGKAQEHKERYIYDFRTTKNN